MDGYRCANLRRGTGVTTQRQAGGEINRFAWELVFPKGNPVARHRAFGAPKGNRTPVSASSVLQLAHRRTPTNVDKSCKFNCLVRFTFGIVRPGFRPCRVEIDVIRRREVSPD